MEQSPIHKRCSDEEAVISLSMMLKYVLKKWRSILCLCLVGLILGAAIGMKPKKEPEVDMRNVDMKKLDIYRGYEELYEANVKNEDEHPFRHLDHNEYYEGHASYYISADASDLDLIGLQFKSIYSNDELWKEMQAAAGEAYTLNDIREYASISYSPRQPENVEVNSIEAMQMMPRNAVLTVRVSGETAEMAESLLSIAQKYVDEMDAFCAKTYPSYKRQNIDRAIQQVRRNYADQVTQGITWRQDILNKMDAMKGKMTADEKLLYSLQYQEELEEDERSITSYLKWPILLTFLMAFLAAGWHVVCFIMNHQIKETDELNSLFGLHVLAATALKHPKKGIDGWLESMGSKNEYPASSETFMLNAIEAMGRKSVLLCGDTSDADVLELMQNLSAKNSGISFCGLLHVDEMAQKTARQAESVVLVCKLWKTTYEQVDREVEVAKAEG